MYKTSAVKCFLDFFHDKIVVWLNAIIEKHPHVYVVYQQNSNNSIICTVLEEKNFGYWDVLIYV